MRAEERERVYIHSVYVALPQELAPLLIATYVRYSGAGITSTERGTKKNPTVRLLSHACLRDKGDKRGRRTDERENFQFWTAVSARVFVWIF